MHVFNAVLISGACSRLCIHRNETLTEREGAEGGNKGQRKSRELDKQASSKIL